MKTQVKIQVEAVRLPAEKRAAYDLAWRMIFELLEKETPEPVQEAAGVCGE